MSGPKGLSIDKKESLADPETCQDHTLQIASIFSSMDIYTTTAPTYKSRESSLVGTCTIRQIT